MRGHERLKEQSRKMIEDALLELMGEKEFARITISEIAKRADVARRTFYRLYRKKEDVLSGYLEKLCLDYKERYGALSRYDVLRISMEFFEFWYGHREVLLLLHRRGLDEMVYGEIGRSSLDVVRNRMAGGMGKGMGKAEELEYFAVYSAGGFANLLRRWVDEGMRGTPEEYGREAGNALGQFLLPEVISFGQAKLSD